MKIEKIYRLIYTSSCETYEGEFYTSKVEAIGCLDDVKEHVRVRYEDWDGYPADSTIYLQEINLNEVEDIDCYAVEVLLSEWALDEEETKQYREDMRIEGINYDGEIWDWRDE